jgi:hypothetical protein
MWIEAVEVKIPICKRASDRQNHEKMGQEDLLARSRILGLVTERTCDKRSCVKPSGSFAGINHTVETWLVCTLSNLAIGRQKRPQITNHIKSERHEQRTVTLIHSTSYLHLPTNTQRQSQTQPRPQVNILEKSSSSTSRARRKCQRKESHETADQQKLRQ